MNELTSLTEALPKRTPQVREVIQYPSEILSKISQPVIPGITLSKQELGFLLDDMAATLKAYRAAGLAAIQIGVDLRVLVVQDENQILIQMINPQILEASGSQYIKEACLSIPGTFVRVPRAETIKVSYFDENLNPQTLERVGFISRAIQHEVAHLDGKTFLDELSDVERQGIMQKIRLRKRKMKALRKQLTR